MDSFENLREVGALQFEAYSPLLENSQRRAVARSRPNFL